MHYSIEQEFLNNNEVNFDFFSGVYTDKAEIKIPNIEHEEIFPRLGFHDEIMLRTWSIIDNLDEILMLPKEYLRLHPITECCRDSMKRGIIALQNRESPLFGQRPKGQEEYVEEYETYCENGYLIV